MKALIHSGRSWRVIRRSALLLGFVLVGRSWADPAVDRTLAALPVYQPEPVTVPAGAAYVRPDGTIAIIGYNDMAEMLSALNALFTRSHPGFKFFLQLKGTATAAPALAYGVSAFAPMGAEFSAIETGPYRQIVGQDPLFFRVAHCSLNVRGGPGGGAGQAIPKSRGDTAAPIGIFVNGRNPLARLTVEQVGRIFSTGAAGGDLTHWAQLGLGGEWADRPIHPCGVAEEAAAGIAMVMLKYKLAGRPFTPAYDAFPQSVDVVKRVADDPMAIGFASANMLGPGVKLLAIAEQAGGYYAPVAAEDIMAGRYPYDRHLLIYVRRAPDQPFDPFVREYLRLALSQQGQRAIAGAVPGYLPLNAREVAEELAKLE